MTDVTRALRPIDGATSDVVTGHCPSRSPDRGYPCERLDTREDHGGGHEHWAGPAHVVEWGAS